jgi:ankyrin repeat protein
MSAARGDVELCSRLIQAGSDPDELHPTEGFAPLHAAVSSEASRTEVIRLLLASGADVNLLRSANPIWSPLMYAATRGSLEHLQLLLGAAACNCMSSASQAAVAAAASLLLPAGCCLHRMHCTGTECFVLACAPPCQSAPCNLDSTISDRCVIYVLQTIPTSFSTAAILCHSAAAAADVQLADPNTGNAAQMTIHSVARHSNALY